MSVEVVAAIVRFFTSLILAVELFIFVDTRNVSCQVRNYGESFVTLWILAVKPFVFVKTSNMLIQDLLTSIIFKTVKRTVKKNANRLDKSDEWIVHRDKYYPYGIVPNKKMTRQQSITQVQFGGVFTA